MNMETGKNTGKEIMSNSIDVEILDRIHLEIKAIQKNGIVETVVDNDDNPRDGKIEADGLLVNEITMDALSEFFLQANVGFVGNHWTTDGQEDFLGDISIDCEDLNHALQEKKLILKKEDEEENYFTFEGLDEYVKKFSEDHYSDERYHHTEE